MPVFRPKVSIVNSNHLIHLHGHSIEFIWMFNIDFEVLVGNIKLVLYDNRDSSPTYKQIQEIYIGEDNYCLVSIPPWVANGFKAVGNKRAIVANCSDIPHDPNEIIRLDPFEQVMNYDWGVKNG